MFMVDAGPGRALYRHEHPQPPDDRHPRRMRPSHDIVLGTGKAPPSADAGAEANLPGRHWHRWRQGGAAISIGFHALLTLALTVLLPQFGAEAHKDVARDRDPLPVEIVKRPPEPDPPKKEQEPEKPKAEVPPQIPEVPKLDPEKQPDAAKAAPPPPKSAPKAAAEAMPPAPAPGPKAPEKAAAPPQPAMPPAPPPASAPGDAPAPPSRPNFAWNPPTAPPPGAPEQPGDLGPLPRAAPAPGDALKLEADVVALPDSKEKPDKDAQYWVLDPLRIDIRNGCGLLVISGAMVLNERVSEGVYRGTIQTTTRTAQPNRSPRCAAQSSLYRVEVRFEGEDVTMLGAGGFQDRGVQRHGVMMLEDAYGRSIWRKR
jgi:hypothetical protein